ncbi:MAG TPA: hypothetical protein VF756_17235 [Thermoanaerobaculia bacterium]
MSHPILRRTAGLFLVLTLLAPWAAAAPEPARGAGSVTERASGLAGLWGWLTRLWAENGCRIDPDGCAPGAADDPSAGSDVDAGCRADPNGTPCTEGQ